MRQQAAGDGGAEAGRGSKRRQRVPLQQQCAPLGFLQSIGTFGAPSGPVMRAFECVLTLQALALISILTTSL